MVRMIPMLDESEAAATRRAVVNGAVQWSILDRGVEMGGERCRWQLDEIVRPEGRLGVQRRARCQTMRRYALSVSRRCTATEADPKPKMPGVRKWSAAQHKRYEQLTKGLEERAREACGENMEEFVCMLDAEMLGAAELVDVEEEERQRRRWRSDHDNCSLRERWRWRLRRLLDMRACKGAVRRQTWILHPKCELRHDVRYFDGVDREGLSSCGRRWFVAVDGRWCSTLVCAVKIRHERSSSCSALPLPSQRRTRWRGRSWRSR